MAKFKCIASGEVYEFTLEHDIKAMRSHTEYVEVLPVEEEPVKKAERSAGRPSTKAVISENKTEE